ncbi:MAG: ribose-phosphate pyrophosphokinase [Phylliscum demangeonii]|nr:MAG: ribose-phosphate pyrophosphokinase [Phylliscum demangeonii]
MVRNIVVLGGSSHPQLNETITNHLGIPPSSILLSKFSVGETRVEIKESVRGKDVYIIQSGCGKVNDHLMELLITISACKTASAKKVTAVLPMFPYSRQSDLPYHKAGAPLVKSAPSASRSEGSYTFESRPQTPYPGQPQSAGLDNGVERLQKQLSKTRLGEESTSKTRFGEESTNPTGTPTAHKARLPNGILKRSHTVDSVPSDGSVRDPRELRSGSEESSSMTSSPSKLPGFQPQPGYKQWVAQAGTLIADLLTCAGADHIITMDLHDPQYQGFFDIPVDNLYARPLLKRYIQYNVPDYKDAVIVSPDAGGAKRATAIADGLGMDFALIHKARFPASYMLHQSWALTERRPTRITDRQNATMMLVGDVANRLAILVDDLADTSNTITRAAKMLKKEGATAVYALLTHGVLSGDAIERINASALDKVVVTNSVPQQDHQARCPKLEVLDVGTVFAEAIRRVHHGESISVLFQNN